MDELRFKLVHAYKDGSLLETFRDFYSDELNGEKTLSTTLADLHNEGHIDLLTLFQNLRKDSSYFFLSRSVFESALPNLNTPVKETADCVKYLILAAGQDMAAYTPTSAFIEFCKKDNDRANELLELSLINIDEEFDHLSTAILAGASNNEVLYVNKAINLLGHENELIRQRAIFSLGRIKFQDETLIKPAALAIEEASHFSSSDIILATAIKALFSIISKSNDLETIFLKFLEIHSQQLGDFYIHAASEILFREKELLNQNIESKLLNICCHTKPKNIGTITNIDYALVRILNQNNFDACVNFLEKLFELSNYEIPMQHFDDFIRELNNHRETYLSSLLTRWFLSKKFKLAMYCTHLIFDINKGVSIRFDTSYFQNKDKGIHVFLAKKACGWFFMYPKVAMSLIESLIPSSPEDELPYIQNIIFNPLCISYTGSIPEQLIDLQTSNQAQIAKTAYSVLSDYEKYQKSIKSALEINELKPSEKDRHSYWRHHSKIMNESMKKARNGSLFTSLFAGNESVLLYGNKSIHYIDHGEQKVRQEIPLQTISHSFEFPSIHNVDPHGLENMLWHFKVEGCTS